MGSMLKTKRHQADICVVGGGIGGMFTAIAAARHGAKVALMHDRPVLGGNASSEIRMWISGAGTRVRDLQETGIMEELLLENMHRNPARNYSTWDALLYEMVRFEKNIDLMLNCTCCDATVEDGKIASIRGFQLTTYTWHEVEAKIFVDSSGDSILAPLTGAEYRVGREAKSEFGEELGLDAADSHTMGMGILLQCRETDHPVSYTPPAWAYDFPDDDAMNNKPHNIYAINTNFYWIELGGMQNSIDDTEEIRDELLKIAFGVWDHMKNHGEHGAENWELEWVGFLPGKRESRRYVGDVILTQYDVEQCTPFPDVVAYGGWQIDNHLPGGFFMSGQSGNHLQKKRLTEPYGIPLRSLYSKNVNNLMFAGRNISASHLAFATTRVMGTCGVLGQAAGTAAALMTRYGMMPRQFATEKIEELQDLLMEDDCFLPGKKRKISPLCNEATLSADWGDASVLLNGTERKIWGNDNGYWGMCNRAITYTFDEKKHITDFRLIVDSDLDREYTEGNPRVLNISATLFRRLDYNRTSFGFPKCILKAFRVEALNDAGEWECVYETRKNHQRMIRQIIDVDTTAIRLIPLDTYFSEELGVATYGSAQAHIFAFEVR